jgi:hypothetical protein
MDITTGVFGLFMLICAYLAQSWARKCYLELRAINEKLAKESK